MPSDVVFVKLDVFGFDDEGPTVRHSVARIDRKVHDDLFDLARIRFNPSQIPARPAHKIHVFAD